MRKGIQRLWLDRFDVYREAADQKVDPAGLTLVSEGHPCLYHGTPNYDQHKRVVTLKEDSVQTSDSISFGLSVDVRAGDLLKLSIRTGQVEWVRVQGAPQISQILKAKTVFVTTDRAPQAGEIV